MKASQSLSEFPRRFVCTHLWSAHDYSKKMAEKELREEKLAEKKALKKASKKVVKKGRWALWRPAFEFIIGDEGYGLL